MKSKYSEILKHIPDLEDHGELYMYYKNLFIWS